MAVGPAGDLALSGELDMASAHVLEAAVAAHMPADRPVELDLEGLTFIDSSGIRCLIQISRSVGETILLRRPTEQVRRILEIALPERAALGVWQIADRHPTDDPLTGSRSGH